jgi:hypothetical protein
MIVLFADFGAGNMYVGQVKAALLVIVRGCGNRRHVLTMRRPNVLPLAPLTSCSG